MCFAQSSGFVLHGRSRMMFCARRLQSEMCMKSLVDILSMDLGNTNFAEQLNNFFLFDMTYKTNQYHKG
jgi:hypothetical protein